jgi:hypothetical protein
MAQIPVRSSYLPSGIESTTVTNTIPENRNQNMGSKFTSVTVYATMVGLNIGNHQFKNKIFSKYFF